MKKVCCLLLCVFLLCSCTPDYSATESDLLPDTLSQAETFDIFAQCFSADADTNADGAVTGMIGMYGHLQAETPVSVLFRCKTSAMTAPQTLAYSKTDGTFSYACPDALCDHGSCLFGGEYNLFAGDKHLFFKPLFGTGDTRRYLCTALDGSGARTIGVTDDCVLLAETDTGVYYQKTVADAETYKIALWHYDFEAEQSVRLTAEGELWEFYAVQGKVYRFDTLAMTLSVYGNGFETETAVAENVTSVYRFDGALYLHDLSAGIIRKVADGKCTDAFDVGGIEFDTFCISGDALYYTCRDVAFIESQSQNKKMYTYLTQYNLSCGRVYRLREGETQATLVYQGTHGGIPDLIQNIYASGELLFIEYRDCKSFKNNYNSKRQGASIAFANARTNEVLDLPSVQ